MNLQLKLIFIFCFVFMSMSAQKCKYSKKLAKKAAKHFTDEKIESATKLRYLFSKFSQAAGTSIIKAESGHYLALNLVREMGRRIDIMANNPLVIQFKNDEILTLYPDRDTPGKFTLPVTTEINRAYYKLTNEELTLLSSRSIVHIKVYFVSDKVSEEKRSVDDLGSFFDYEVLSERYQNNLLEAANCTLQNQ